MSRFTKRGRRVAVLGAAGLGACALLAACSPVQMGAAATVGSQRITVSTLDSQVSNLQTAIKPYGSTLSADLPAAQMPTEVLSWLIRFAVMDQVAAANGITVTEAESQAGLSSLATTAQENGFSSTDELLVASGIPPQLFPQVGRYLAQETAYGTKANGGKTPTSAQATAVDDAIDKAECTAATSLDIKVSPQFGRFDYAPATFGVVAAADTLSRPQGTPTPASTEGLTPAAC